MSNTVKLLLVVALFLFIIGTTWAIVVAVKNHKHNNSGQTTAQTPTATASNSPATNSAPAAEPTPTASQTVAPTAASATKKPAAHRAAPKKMITFNDNTEASASALAGVNPDGSTYANAVAN